MGTPVNCAHISSTSPTAASTQAPPSPATPAPTTGCCLPTPSVPTHGGTCWPPPFATSSPDGAAPSPMRRFWPPTTYGWKPTHHYRLTSTARYAEIPRYASASSPKPSASWSPPTFPTHDHVPASTRRHP